MGLDMYLNAKRFLWHNEEDVINQVSEAFPELGSAKVKQVTAEVGYWRKSNQIHKWFVDNVQNGVDDCGDYEVSYEKLEELLELINKVLSEKGKADSLLPTQGGFFFGDTKYDDYYFDDLTYTKELLEKLVSNKESMRGWYFEYHSSW